LIGIDGFNGNLMGMNGWRFEKANEDENEFNEGEENCDSKKDCGENR